MIPQVTALAKSAALLDAVAEQQGRGPDYVTGEAQNLAASAGASLAGAVEGAAGAVLSEWLQRNMPGVQLDSNEPFSDSSLSRALSSVLGVHVASVRGREALRDAFKLAAAAALSNGVGSDFEDLFDAAKVRRDMLRAVGVYASNNVPGLSLSDLGDKRQTASDLFEFAALGLARASGISISSVKNPRALKADLIAWALPLIEEKVAEETAGGSYHGRLLMDSAHVKHREAQRKYREAMRGRIRYVGLWERGQNGQP